MHANISAKGYTSVVMVLNMKRFIHKDSQPAFETIRGTQEFTEVLRNNWAEACNEQDVFQPLANESDPDLSFDIEEMGKTIKKQKLKWSIKENSLQKGT